MKSNSYFKIGNITLTERQAESLAAMMLGYTAPEVAELLNIKVRTINSYRSDIKKIFNGESKSKTFRRMLLSKFPLKKFSDKFNKGIRK